MLKIEKWPPESYQLGAETFAHLPVACQVAPPAHPDCSKRLPVRRQGVSQAFSDDDQELKLITFQYNYLVLARLFPRTLHSPASPRVVLQPIYRYRLSSLQRPAHQLPQLIP